MKNIFQRFKNYYQRSEQNRMGLHVFLGFAVIPIIALTLTYILMHYFYVK